VAGQGDRRQPQARGPPLGPLVQQRDPGLGQRDARGLQQLAGLLLGKAQVRRADLGQLAGQPQLVQAQPHIVTRGQDRVHARGRFTGSRVSWASASGEVSSCRSSITSVTPPGTSASSDSTPVGHRRRIVVRRRCRRFRAAACTGGLPDRVEQGQPELLSISREAARATVKGLP
jgi:hypothetical protein